jgi:hypothetical protein
VSAVTSLVGGIMGANAITSAQNSANATQMQMYNQTRNDLLPYNTAGQTATTQEQSLLGLNGQDAANAAMSTYQTSPGYQWQMQQGLRGVDAGAAASGLLRSGATLKAEDTFASGLANSDFSNYYNRLSGISSLGESAAAQTGQAATATGQGIASTDTSGAAALASIYGNTAKSLGNQSNSLFNSLYSGGFS